MNPYYTETLKHAYWQQGYDSRRAAIERMSLLVNPDTGRIEVVCSVCDGVRRFAWPVVLATVVEEMSDHYVRNHT